VSNLFHYQRRAEEPPYDVVFCLGLLYHVAKPVELFEVMANAGADIIVIDTEVSLSPGSMFQIYTEVTPMRSITRRSFTLRGRQSSISPLSSGISACRSLST
jgi:hypothetical protein